MTTDLPFTTCFVTIAPSGSAHYRAALPAYMLGAGLLARTSGLEVVKDTEPIEADCYVYHLPWSRFQLEEIADRQREGSKVLVDVDDYLWAFPMKEDHVNAGAFTEERLGIHQAALNMADGVIVSTPWLAETLARRHGARIVGVAPNGVDLPRFTRGGKWGVEKPADAVIIGWSGSTGHANATTAVADAVNAAMERFPNAIFVSVGDPAAAIVEDQERAQHVHWQPMGAHAALLCSFDVNIGPGLDDDFYRAKSDLRFLEAAAAKTAFIGHRTTYGETVQHGKTGFVYDSEDDFYEHLCVLLEDRKLRRTMAFKAHSWALQYGSADKPRVFGAWRTAIETGMGT